MIDIGNITFENHTQDGHKHWSDVMLNNKCIGALCEIDTSYFNPIRYWYQKLIKEDELTGSECKHYPSETKGYVFVMFEELEDLLEYLKEK